MVNIVDKMLIKFKESYSKSILAFSLTMIFGSLIFIIRNMLDDNMYIFMHSDCQSQIIPMLKMFIRQLFAEHNILYSFDFGLGAGTIPVFTNGSCFSFFNLIFLLPLNVDLQAFLLVISKLSFTAFCFNEMCRRVFRRNDFLSVSLSFAYSLCSFNLVYYYILIWQDGFYMLPVIVTCIYGLVKDGKCFCLIIAYAYLFVCNFYSGYIIGIYSFLILSLMMIFIKIENKHKINIMLKYFTCVIVSCMISSFALLPTAMFLLNNDTSESTVFTNSFINIFDLIKQFFMGQYVLDEEKGVVPYIYVGILPFLYGSLIFLKKNIKKQSKIIFGIMLGFLIFCSLLKPGYIFMHAFNNPDNFGYRFGFLFSFTILLMFLYIFDFFEKNDRKKWILISGLYIAFLLVYYMIFRRISGLADGGCALILANVIFIVIYLIIFYKFYKIKHGFEIVVGSVLIVEIIINGVVVGKTVDRSISENKMVFNYFYSEETDLVSEVAENYTRISMPNSIVYNESQLMGYRSVCAFSSFLNTDLRKSMRRMGYAASDLEIKDMGGNNVTEMLLGVDYTLVTNDYSGSLKETYIESNKALPIAYMTNKDILNVEFENNPFENLNNVLSGLVGEDIEYFYDTSDRINISSYNVKTSMDVYNDDEVYTFFLDNPDEKFGEITFEDATGESRYCYFEMQDSYMYYNSPVVCGSDEEYMNAFDKSYISLPHMVEMGEKGESTNAFIILDENSTTGYYFSDYYFYGIREEVLDDVYKKLKSDGMQNIIFKDGYVSGDVVSTYDDSVLFTSIPYDKGWNVYIDGKKTDSIGLLGKAFLGANIPEGKHYIEIKYRDVWFEIGIIVSAVGVLILIVICFFENKNKRGSDER